MLDNLTKRVYSYNHRRKGNKPTYKREIFIMDKKELKNVIISRVDTLNEQGNFDLGNAWESLNYLLDEYQEEKSNVSFSDWLDNVKEYTLSGSAVSDVDYWISDLINLSNTDVSDDNIDLIDSYIKLI